MKQRSGSSSNRHLQWVTGHRNIEGNEWADRIAKSSTTISDSGVRHTKISQNLFNSKIDKWLSKIWELERLSAATNSTIRIFPPSLSSLKALSNTPPRQIFQIISGHCSLNAFLYKIKKNPLLAAVFEWGLFTQKNPKKIQKIRKIRKNPKNPKNPKKSEKSKVFLRI